jgi:drug/metabolite transporter (DMT)-like permease
VPDLRSDANPLTSRQNRSRGYLPACLRQPSPYLLLSLSALFWAGNWVVGRAMRLEIPPVAMGFWRWALALAILLPFTFGEIRANRKLLRENWIRLSILGSFGATAFNTMIYVGLQHTAATNGVLFNSVSPVLIILFSWLALRERISLRQALGVAASLVGIAIMIARGEVRTLAGLQFNQGDLWLFCAMNLWALYTVILRRRQIALSPSGFLAAILLCGLPWLLPFYLWEIWTRGGFELGLASVGTLAYYGTLPSVVAYLFWNRGVAQVGANKAGLFAHLIPVFGAALSILFLGESLHGYHLAGAGMIFMGIYLTTARMS